MTGVNNPVGANAPLEVNKTANAHDDGLVPLTNLVAAKDVSIARQVIQEVMSKETGTNGKSMIDFLEHIFVEMCGAEGWKRVQEAVKIINHHAEDQLRALSTENTPELMISIEKRMRKLLKLPKDQVDMKQRAAVEQIVGAIGVYTAAKDISKEIALEMEKYRGLATVKQSPDLYPMCAQALSFGISVFDPAFSGRNIDNATHAILKGQCDYDYTKPKDDPENVSADELYQKLCESFDPGASLKEWQKLVGPGAWVVASKNTASIFRKLGPIKVKKVVELIHQHRPEILRYFKTLEEKVYNPLVQIPVDYMD